MGQKMKNYFLAGPRALYQTQSGDVIN